MRFVVLLAFGGMGAGLLYLGWIRYQTATNELNSWTRVRGVIEQADEDGYVVTYQAKGETFRTSGGRWLGWPKVNRGDQFGVVYDPASPASARVNAWQETYQETLLLLFFASIGLFLGIGGFFAAGDAPRPSADAVQQPMEEEAEEREVSFSLGEPIELRHPKSTVVLMAVGAVVVFLIAIALFWWPDILGTRWFSWPLGGVAVVLSILIAAAAYEQKNLVLRADLNGLREEARWTKKEAAWTQVAKIVRLRRTMREYSQVTKRHSTRTVGYTWVLSDRNGAELLKIDEDMVPQDALRRLLRYIPGRTGLAVEERTE